MTLSMRRFIIKLHLSLRRPLVYIGERLSILGKLLSPKKFKVEMEFLLLDRVERLLGHLWLIIQRRIE